MKPDTESIIAHRARAIERKKRLEEDIETSTKERFVMFKTLDKITLNTAEWRKLNAEITILTRAIAKMRQSWKTADKSY